jgi:hypothetical protein
MASIPSLKTLTERLGPFVVKEHGEERAKILLRRLREMLSSWKIQKELGYEIQSLASRRVKARDVLEYADKVVLDAHGIEYLQHRGRPGQGAYYVNMGDTYDTTLLLDTRKDRFLVTSWGDFVESEERQGRKFA